MKVSVAKFSSLPLILLSVMNPVKWTRLSFGSTLKSKVAELPAFTLATTPLSGSIVNRVGSNSTNMSKAPSTLFPVLTRTATVNFAPTDCSAIGTTLAPTEPGCSPRSASPISTGFRLHANGTSTRTDVVDTLATTETIAWWLSRSVTVPRFESTVAALNALAKWTKPGNRGSPLYENS